MHWKQLLLRTLAGCIALLPTALVAQDANTADGAYQIQVGDTVDIKYRLTPEYDQTMTILPDGDVSLTLLGSVHLAGLTLTQAHDELVRRAAIRLRDPELSVSVKEASRDHFSVIGEVTTPGRFELHGPITVVEALATAGGFNRNGAQKNVTLVHRLSRTSEYGEATRLDFTKLRKLDRTTPMPFMRPGDILLVTSSKTAKLERLVRISNIGLYYPLN